MKTFNLADYPQLAQYAREFIREQNLDHKKGITPIFVALTGSHLYGFPSEDSDYDIRGCYASSLEKVLGIKRNEEHLGEFKQKPPLELDISMHELKSFLKNLTKPNGNFLEQLHSPYVLLTSDEHQELKELSQELICKRLFNHYYEFGKSMKEEGKKKGLVKKHLYAARLYMTGILLLKTGNIIPDINILNRDFKIPLIDELVQAKETGELSYYQKDIVNATQTINQLEEKLTEAYEQSNLPNLPQNISELNDFLIRFRKKQFEQLNDKRPKSRQLYSAEERMLELMRLYISGELDLYQYRNFFEDVYTEDYGYGGIKDLTCPLENRPDSHDKIYQAIKYAHDERDFERLEGIVKEEAKRLRVESRISIPIDF